MKIVIIGLGSIAKKHIAAIKEISPDAELFALRSSSSYSPVEGIESFSDFSQIDSIIPDFILISNPTSEHFGTIERLKNTDIPLFIEKPIFDKAGADQSHLCEFFTHRNAHTYVACNLRFLDCLAEMKKMLQGVKVNEVNAYCGSYLPDWRPGVDFRTVYSANKELGGGVHIDLIHELDYIYWMFGSPLKANTTFTSKSSLNISAFDYANYVWTFENFTANVVLNYYRRDAKRTLEILTEDDTFLVDLLKNKIYKNSELYFESGQTMVDTYNLQMSFFLENLKNKKSGFNSINEAYEILKLCLNA